MSRRKREHKRWRAQTLDIHRHLTGQDSKARAEGLMPGYADHAFTIALAACKLAGMAKKRWRDASKQRMMLRDVKVLRTRIDASFDKLEALLRDGGPGRSGVRAMDEAHAAYGDHGLLGFLAIAMMEEAGELAEPLHAIATGRSSPDAEREHVAEESSDVRMYMHLVTESLSIDADAATERKSAGNRARMPEFFDPRNKPKVEVLTPEEVARAVATLMIPMKKKEKTT
jgi:hypothetical protein